MRYGRATARLRRQRAKLAAAPYPTFIGGARFRARGGLNSGARWNFTRPSAWLELRDDRIVLSLRDEARLLGRQMRPPVPEVTTLGLTDIGSFERFSRGGIRFRTVDPDDDRDGLVFWARRSD